jgi:hypothetical protein
MRRYRYQCTEGREKIFGGYFEYQIRGDYALVLLADHLIPLSVSEIPTQIYRRFLFPLQPARIGFVEFDPSSRCYYLLDLRWTDSAGAFRYLGAAALTQSALYALGLTTPWWSEAVAGIGAPPRRSARAAA